MKFLLDAHLPPSLRQVFADAGHDALHTLDLPEQNASQDGALNAVSIAAALETCTLVEIDRQTVSVVV